MITTSTSKILENYLRDIGWLEPITLGWDENTPVSPQIHQALEVTLQHTKKRNENNLWTAWAGFGIDFFIFLYLIFSHPREQIFVAISLSLCGVILLVIAVKILKRHWQENSLLRLTENVLQNLPPMEAAEFINKMYWSLKVETN